MKIEPLPVNDEKALIHLTKQINFLNWLTSQLPEKENLLIAKMCFAIRNNKQANKNEIYFLIQLGLLKHENDKISVTNDLQDYVKESVKEIKAYVKGEKGNQKQ